MTTKYGRPEDMTEQGVFDKVVAHMMLQGQKCLGCDGECDYRDSSGKMACAAGCLLTDEEASVTANNDWSVVAPEDLEFCIGMVERMQRIHDARPVREWTEALRSVAIRYELDTTVLDTCERGGELKEDNHG